MTALRLLGIALALIGGGMMRPPPPTVVDVKPTRIAALIAAFGAVLIIVSILIN